MPSLHLSLLKGQGRHFLAVFFYGNLTAVVSISLGNGHGVTDATADWRALDNFHIKVRQWQGVSSFFPASGHKKSREPFFKISCSVVPPVGGWYSVEFQITGVYRRLLLPVRKTRKRLCHIVHLSSALFFHCGSTAHVPA